MKEQIIEVKKKREFSELPDSIVERALNLCSEDVKETRALLRKYFGVFLTNKVLKVSDEEILKFHISSKGRDYKEFYSKIFDEGEKVGSVIDLGCGVTGFSYKILREVVGDVYYMGIEASGQLVKKVNDYFKYRGLESAHVIKEDLFNLENILKLLSQLEKNKPRIVFMFQVVDALESFEKDFSKKFILEISKECEKIVLSLPTRSLGGKTRFAVQRKWLTDFLDENFIVEKDFEIGGERVLIFRKK